jgi:hypothetical protein
LGKKWKLLKNHERAPYFKLANDERDQHRLLFPDYKYRPGAKVIQRKEKKETKKNKPKMVLPAFVDPLPTIVPLSPILSSFELTLTAQPDDPFFNCTDFEISSSPIDGDFFYDHVPDELADTALLPPDHPIFSF